MEFPEYHKINSIFKRDEKGMFTNEFATPEFKFLKDLKWRWDEKIDGTNIRIGWDGTNFIVGGRTSNAQIPASLFARINEITKESSGLFSSYADTIIFGEGFGEKIQGKIGAAYSPVPLFVAFDVMIKGTYLYRDDARDVCRKLNIEFVPEIGSGTIEEAIEFIKTTAGETKSKWGSQVIEGLVLRPETELKTKNNQRIITKLKIRDYK